MNAKPALPNQISDKITTALEEMEKEEVRALGKGPAFIEKMTPLWYIAYKTEAQ